MSRPDAERGAVPAGESGPDARDGATAPEEHDRMAQAYARARARDARVRAQLQPLGPGERPRPLQVAIALAVLVAAANVILLLAGWDVDGADPSALGTFLFAGLLLAAAVGMWQRRYLAVLGFEALLGIGVTYAGLSLLVASNLPAIGLCLVVMVGGGWLFWKLVRVMARIQAGREAVG